MISQNGHCGRLTAVLNLAQFLRLSRVVRLTLVLTFPITLRPQIVMYFSFSSVDSPHFECYCISPDLENLLSRPGNSNISILCYIISQWMPLSESVLSGVTFSSCLLFNTHLFILFNLLTSNWNKLRFVGSLDFQFSGILAKLLPSIHLSQADYRRQRKLVSSGGKKKCFECKLGWSARPQDGKKHKDGEGMRTNAQELKVQILH